jgi:hypothetical protein
MATKPAVESIATQSELETPPAATRPAKAKRRRRKASKQRTTTKSVAKPAAKQVRKKRPTKKRGPKKARKKASKMATATRRPKKRSAKRLAAPTDGRSHALSLDDLVEVKKIADQLGGIQRLDEALQALKKLL